MSRVTAAPPAEAAGGTPAVVTAMWRGLNVLRPLAWLYAVYALGARLPEVQRPWVGWAVLAVLGAWTAVMLFRRATALLLGIELAIAAAGILATRWADTMEVIQSGARTLPGFWPAAAVVGWAILRGWRGGLPAALVIGAADLVEVVTPNPHTINNIVLLLALGGCIGFVADGSRAAHADLQRALLVQAQVRERDRLARAVHDGVLQTLAYIHRRGTQLGGQAGALGAMAADQERLLRALVSGVPSPELAQAVEGETDVRRRLARYAGEGVQVVAPAEPVRLPARVAEELSAAVEAVLDNVRRHAGPGAAAWVLIDDEGPTVRITVRDNGVGMSPERLAQARDDGRMGVATSIQSRLRDLGGRAEHRSAPGSGTTVELCVPKEGKS